MNRMNHRWFRGGAPAAVAGLTLLAPRGAAARQYMVNTSDMRIQADGKCGLAEAIQAINTRAPVPDAAHPDCAAGNGQDIISFATSLSGVPLVATGTLFLRRSVEIRGLGIGKTIVRSNLTVGTELISVHATDNSSVDVTLQDLTLDRASTQVMPQVTGVYAAQASSWDHTVRLTRVRVTKHTWSGVYSDGANIIINDSTIDGNTSTDSGGGIAVVASEVASGSLLVTHSTISGNSSSGGSGGGIYWVSGGNSHVDNSTVSGNTALDAGGGISFAPSDGSGYFQITNSTVAFNRANFGGGVASPVVDHKSAAFLSLFSNNTAQSGVGADWSGKVQTMNHCLLAQANDGALTIQIPTPTDRNLFGVDPKLDPTLRDLGGNHVKVHNLLTGSRAIDYASSESIGEGDARRLPRGVEGDGIAGTRLFDIGALERQAP